MKSNTKENVTPRAIVEMEDALDELETIIKDVAIELGLEGANLL